jgi:integrase
MTSQYSARVQDVGGLVRQGKHRQAQVVLQLLGVILQAALKMRLLTHNPARAIERPRRAREEMRTLTVPEIGRLLDCLDGSWAKPIIGLLLSTGLRRSEALGLKWSDVKLERGELAVRRSYHKLVGNVTALAEPKTTRSRRTLALDKGTLRLLADHRVRMVRDWALLGRHVHDEDFVFARMDGTPWPPMSVSQAFRRAAAREGIKVRLHDLRHTNASLLLHAGVNARVISARLGHASAAFTLNVYSHLMPDSDRDAAEKLGTVLDGAAARSLPAIAGASS